MKKLLFYLLLIAPLSTTFTQTTLRGDLFDYIKETIDHLPPSGGDDYQDISMAQESQWRAVITDILNNEYMLATSKAASLDYQLIRFVHEENGIESEFYLLEKDSLGENYFGTYLFNPAACRELVIQCPHPRADLNTGLEGIFAFKTINTRAYFLSGTHRCNSTEQSPCSGTTSVCSSSSQPYLKSDPAHNVRSAFHIATEVVADLLPETTFVQLHGFSKRDTDPYVIMSNGGRDVPPIDYAVLIQEELEAVDAVLTFELGHLNPSWTRLLGFTNTQGRYLNNSLDPCTEGASRSNGRFIHVEQERIRLRADETGWNKMKTALEMAFPCQTTSTADLPLTFLPYHITQSGILILDRGFSPIQIEVQVFNLLGQLVFSQPLSTQEHLQLPRLSGPGLMILSNQGQLLGRQLYWIP